MVAATKNFRPISILSLSFRFLTLCVLLILDTNWPHMNGVNPPLGQFVIGTLAVNMLARKSLGPDDERCLTLHASSAWSLIAR